MQPSMIGACILGILLGGARAQGQPSPAPRGTRIAIAASAVFDGKGQVLHDARIAIEGSKIVAVHTGEASNFGPVDYDLRGLTVLPGWIDAHVHIAWSFGADGLPSTSRQAR